MLLFLLLLLGRVESQCSSLQYGVQEGELISAVIFGDVILEGTCMGAMAIKGNAKFNKWNAGGSLSNTQMYAVLAFGELMIECGNFHGDILHERSIVVGGRTTMSGYNQAQVDAKTMMDIDDVQAYYLELSESITKMRGLAIGSQSRVVQNNRMLNFYGTTRDFDIFQVDSSVLCNANGIQFHRLLASSYTTVIININYDGGRACYGLKLDQVNGFPFNHASSHVLWNFWHDGDFDLSGELIGSLLAPRLNVLADNGNIQGQCITQSATGSIYLSADWFTGCVPKDKCYILAQDCPVVDIPPTCIDPKWEENLDTCCPDLKCADSCAGVPCPPPVPCQGGYTSTIIEPATSTTCCDVYACIPNSARSSVSYDPVVEFCPKHIEVSLPNIATTFMTVDWEVPRFLFVDSIQQSHQPGSRFSQGRTVVQYIGNGFKPHTSVACYFIVDVKRTELHGACAVDGAVYEQGQWVYDKCLRKCQCKNGNIGDCRRVRKELASMPKEERTNYYRVWLKVYAQQGSELVRLINNHLQFFSRGLHNNGGFLPWHRGFLLNAEDVFIVEDCTATIPYFDWNMHTHIASSHIWGDAPDQMSGSGDRRRCVQTGIFGFANGFRLTNGQCMQRRLSNGAAATPVYVQTRLFDAYPNPSDYDRFRNRIEHGPGLHDSIHCIVGGTMCSARSSNDPIFWSHHAHIDNIWNDWQKQSDDHKFAYSGNTGLNSLLPTSPFTPAQMLDCENLGTNNVHLVYFKEEEYLALTNAVGLMNDQQKQSIRHPIFSDPGQQLFSDMNMADADVQIIRAKNELANLNAVKDSAFFLHRNIVERATGSIGLQEVVDMLAAGLAGKWLSNGKQQITADDLFNTMARVIRDNENVPTFMEIREYLLTDPSGAIVDVIEVQEPVGCVPSHRQVCADGRVFDNECEAQSAGYQVWNNGPCPQEPILVPDGAALDPDIDGGATDSYGHALQTRADCPDSRPQRGSMCTLIGLTCYYGLFCCEEYETTATCDDRHQWQFGDRRWASCRVASSCPPPAVPPPSNPVVRAAVTRAQSTRAAQQQVTQATTPRARAQAQQQVTAAVNAVRQSTRVATRSTASSPRASATRLRVSVPTPAPRPAPRRVAPRQAAPVRRVAPPAPPPPAPLPPIPRPPPVLPAPCPRFTCPRGPRRPHCCEDGYEVYQPPSINNCPRGCWTCRNPLSGHESSPPNCCWREPVCTQISCRPPNVVHTIVPADKHNNCCAQEDCRPQVCDLSSCPGIITCRNSWEVAVPLVVGGVPQLDEYNCCPQYVCQFNACTRDTRECSPGVFVSRLSTSNPPCQFEECPLVCDMPTQVRTCRMPNNRFIPQQRNPPQRGNPDSCRWLDCPPYEPCDDPALTLQNGDVCDHGTCIRGRQSVECRCEENYQGARCGVFVPPPRQTFTPPARSFLMPKGWNCDVIFCCNGFCFITRNLQRQLNGAGSSVSFTLVFGMTGIFGQGPNEEVYVIDGDDFLAGLMPNGRTTSFSWDMDQQAVAVFSDPSFTPALTDFSDMTVTSDAYPPLSELQYVVNAHSDWNQVTNDGVCHVKAWLTKERIMYFNDANAVHHVTCATNQGQIDLKLEQMCDNPCIVNGVEEKCNDHGFCVWGTGLCQCQFPWTGPRCGTQIRDAQRTEPNPVPPQQVYSDRFNGQVVTSGGSQGGFVQHQRPRGRFG